MLLSECLLRFLNIICIAKMGAKGRCLGLLDCFWQSSGRFWTPTSRGLGVHSVRYQFHFDLEYALCVAMHLVSYFK